MKLIDGSKLTEAEGQVLVRLADAWNAFLELPKIHEEDKAEFRQAIHAAQNIVLARAAYSEVTLSPGVEVRIKEITKDES